MLVRRYASLKGIVNDNGTMLDLHEVFNLLKSPSLERYDKMIDIAH